MDDSTHPRSVDHVVALLKQDDERAIRLTTAKLCVALAELTPEAVVPVVSSLADYLDDENAHVRGRAAEALGLLARAGYDDVALPEDGPPMCPRCGAPY